MALVSRNTAEVDPTARHELVTVWFSANMLPHLPRILLQIPHSNTPACIVGPGGLFTTQVMPASSPKVREPQVPVIKASTLPCGTICRRPFPFSL